MFSIADLEPQPFYKCNFCDIIFTSFSSVLKHNTLYCHRRNKLPRSSTVTTSMLSDVAMTSGGSSKNESSGDQSCESEVAGTSAESESSSEAPMTTEDLKSLSDVTTHFLRDNFGNAQNLETGIELKFPAKRKLSQVEKEELVDESSSLDENPNASEVL